MDKKINTINTIILMIAFFCLITISGYYIFEAISSEGYALEDAIYSGTYYILVILAIALTLTTIVNCIGKENHNSYKLILIFILSIITIFLPILLILIVDLFSYETVAIIGALILLMLALISKIVKK